MRWIRFTADDVTQFGIVEGENVAAVTGDPFSGYERSGETHALDSVRLEVPVIPRTFYAAGLNYVDHIMAYAKKVGREPNIPDAADIGYRANNALVAHGDSIVIPHDATDRVEYEAEIVAVVGKTTKNISEADALSCLLGYTIGNDVSERSWQKSDRTLWRAK
nr:fumarylacetoacetate hydrolase family protein [Gammaproteobacteria bacterium]